ncbi:MAG: 5'-nucleotidase C-terminal domain-containing protein [Chloroflexota bacterium]
MLRKLSLVLVVLSLVALSLMAVTAQDEETFTLTILHTNDTHAAHEPNGDGDGGVARQATVVNQVRAEIDNVLLLDAGDRFSGTLYHTVHAGQDQVPIMNALGYDAMVLGNHEFNNGGQVLADFVTGLDFPVLAANIDFSASPTMPEGAIAPFVILEVGGQEIGVVGIDTPDTLEISNPEAELVWRDDLVAVVNEQSSALTEMGVNKIVLLTHVGTNVDFEIAPQLENVDIVIGGHSHTLLSNQNSAFDAYPVTFTNEATGETIYYVQSGANNQYLGRMDVEFDAAGVVTDFEGDSIFLSRYIAPNTELDAILADLAEEVNALRDEPANAVSEVPLDGDRSICRVEECNLGNLIADAQRWETGTDVAIMNSGGIRRDLPAAELTLGELLEVQPFSNTIATMDVTGDVLLAALENGVSRVGFNEDGLLTRDDNSGRFPQVSGMRFSFDPNLESGSRVTEVEILQEDGSYVPLDPAATYSLTVPNFVATGGDGYSMLAEQGQNIYLFGRLDWEVTRDYMQLLSPIGADDGIQVDAQAPRINLMNAVVAPLAE